MSGDRPTVQAELLRPREIEAALAERSVVYLPLGSIEWHSHHLPMGLDGLTAHGVCVEAAARTGGIVMPTLYYGTGGGHTTYPWTIMTDTDGPLAELLSRSLQRLDDAGVEIAVLFTGHFAPEQIHLVDRLTSEWVDHRNLHVIGLSVSQAPARLPPDHAGVFETTLLSALWPARVDLSQLATPIDASSIDPDGNVFGHHRHDPAHPLHGIFGPDPRQYEPAAAAGLLDDIVTWTSQQVDAARAEIRLRSQRSPTPDFAYTFMRQNPGADRFTETDRS